MNNSRTSHLTLHILGCLACTMMVVPLMAQESGVASSDEKASTTQVPMSTFEFVQQKLDDLETTALKAVKPLPEGESRNLIAIVMQRSGKAQWRANENGTWQSAQVDDSLPTGAMIRTGLKSSLTLRVGLNSSILIDSNARVSLPQIIQDGDLLQTAVKVERGRADVKVNHVGLTNDFSVVTPTGALAVKGTGFACRHDAFNGTSIVGAKTNTMNAIEVHYYASKLAYYLSGGAISNNKNENPTLAALIEAAPPPSANKAEQQDAADQEGSAGGAVTNTDPISQTVRVDLAIQSQAQAEAIIEELEEEYDEIAVPPTDVLLLPGFEFFNDIGNLEYGSLIQGAVAAAIYFDMVGQNGNLQHPGLQLIQGEFHSLLMQRLNYNGNTTAMVNEIIAYGNNEEQQENDYPPNVTHLRAILTIVDTFCRNTYAGDQVKIQICRECFTDAVVNSLSLTDQGGNSYFEYLLENLEDGWYEEIDQ